jgi:hypothetical protein
MNNNILAQNDATERLYMGRVTVTARSKKTGEHITLRVRSKNRTLLKKRYITFEQAAIVCFDVPAHGQGKFDMVGYVHAAQALEVRKNRTADPARYWVAQQVWRYFLTNELHPQLELKIEAYCGHCGRALNDPVSINRGFGPECFGKMTGSKHQTRESREPAQESGLSPYAQMQGVVQNAAVAEYAAQREEETRQLEDWHCDKCGETVQLRFHNEHFGGSLCENCDLEVELSHDDTTDDDEITIVDVRR